MTSSGKNIFRVAGPLWGRFTGHRWIPLTKWRSFDVFFDLRLKKRLSKQTRRRWFETHRANYDVTNCNWYSFTVRVWSTIYLQIHDCYCCRFFRMPSGNWLIVDGREENMPILHSPHNIFFLVTVVIWLGPGSEIDVQLFGHYCLFHCGRLIEYRM